MRKVQTQATKDFNESYIQSDPLLAVSTVPQTTHQEKDPPSSDLSDLVISMLNKVLESNQALAQRVEKMKHRQLTYGSNNNAQSPGQNRYHCILRLHPQFFHTAEIFWQSASLAHDTPII